MSGKSRDNASSDFVIAAPALHVATALMTLNRDDFARIVPRLPLIVPSLETALPPGNKS